MRSLSKPVPMLIDTDAGVDDALAIILAMHSPEVRVEAITTVAGNVEVEKCTRNVNVVLDSLDGGRRPVVVQGAGKPLKVPLTTAPEVHGVDGLGNTQRAIKVVGSDRSMDAVECIRENCERFEGTLTIVALGPLTNIASTLKKYPGSLRKARRIVSMGGALRVAGNTGPVAEFNYFVDPHAAHEVLNARLPLVVVPLDVTEQIVLLRKDLRALVRRRPSNLSSFVLKLTGTYMKYHLQTLGFEGGYLHDPLAMAIAIWPSIAKYLHEHVDVECVGRFTRGMTVSDARLKGQRSDPEIVVTFDHRKFLGVFRHRVLAY